MVDWYRDLKHAFRSAFPEDETIVGRGELPDPFYAGLAESLGTLGEVDFVHAVEHEDKTSFLIVRQDSAWLVRFAEPSSTETIFFGDLRGGRYRESVTVDDKGSGEIEAVYKHRRIGREELRARIPRFPPGTPGAHLSTETEYALERGAQLRRRFRRWSMGEDEDESEVD